MIQCFHNRRIAGPSMVCSLHHIKAWMVSPGPFAVIFEASARTRPVSARVRVESRVMPVELGGVNFMEENDKR